MEEQAACILRAKVRGMRIWPSFIGRITWELITQSTGEGESFVLANRIMKWNYMKLSLQINSGHSKLWEGVPCLGECTQ
jgi:hypothetical protein